MEPFARPGTQEEAQAQVPQEAREALLRDDLCGVPVVADPRRRLRLKSGLICPPMYGCCKNSHVSVIVNKVDAFTAGG